MYESHSARYEADKKKTKELYETNGVKLMHPNNHKFRDRNKEKELDNPSITGTRIPIRGYYHGGGTYDMNKTKSLSFQHKHHDLVFIFNYLASYKTTNISI